MKIYFYPFIQTMIEQYEVLELIEDELIFSRMYGPELVTQKFKLSNELLEMFKKLEVCNSELKEGDFVCINDSIRFNLNDASLSYKTLSKLLTISLDFKYMPRAINFEEVLFYLGDYKKMYEYHYYQEALDLIKKYNLNLVNNSVTINGETITIELNKYKVVSFNTNNKLYQVVLSTLAFNVLM